MSRGKNETPPVSAGGVRRASDERGSAVTLAKGETKGGEPGTALQTLDEYAAGGGYNVLRPIATLTSADVVSPILVAAVSVVSIDASADAGEVYHDFRYANAEAGRCALSSLGLAKLAAAAGVKWIPELCKVLERDRSLDGHVYIRFQAAGAIRETNGEWHVEVAEKEIDTADEAEELEDAYRRKLKAGRARFAEADIPEMVRREILQLRKFILGHAETKAKSRVLRRLLSLKQVYTTKELARPFAVPRLLYRPDLTDPMQLEQVQIEGRRAAAELYGVPPSQAGQGAEAGDSLSLSEPPPDQSEPGPEPPRTRGKDAEAPAASSERSEKPSAGATAQKRTRPQTEGEAPAGGPEPSERKAPRDMRVDVEPYVDDLVSNLVDQDPAWLLVWLRGKEKDGRKLEIRQTAAAWIDYLHPRLGDAT